MHELELPVARRLAPPFAKRNGASARRSNKSAPGAYSYFLCVVFWSSLSLVCANISGDTCVNEIQDLRKEFIIMRNERDQCLSTCFEPSADTSTVPTLQLTSDTVDKTAVQKKKMLRHFPSQYVSFKHLIPSSNKLHGERRRLTQCPTFKFVDDNSLSPSNGVNILTYSCTLGSDFTIPSGKTLKIKKDPTMVGELVIDRQATRTAHGRHFYVTGNLFVEGVTLTGGYVSAFFYLISMMFFCRKHHSSMAVAIRFSVLILVLV
jgi:ribosome-binding factor A